LKSRLIPFLLRPVVLLLPVAAVVTLLAVRYGSLVRDMISVALKLVVMP